MREILERELIELGLGHMLGEPYYYYQYHSTFGRLIWERRIRDLINSVKNLSEAPGRLSSE